jgi:2-keto-3-deoxy-L-rhamnonate aldolase RhmA
VETVKAFENLEEIASVPGLDVAWVGHYDLTVSMGIPCQFEHPRFLEAMHRLVTVCGQHKVPCGFLPPTPADAVRWIESGFRAISLGSDVGVFMEGIRGFRSSVVANHG